MGSGSIMTLPFCDGAMSIILVLARCGFGKLGGGVLLAAIGELDMYFSIDWCSANSSKAADRCLASSLRSSVHDFDRCRRPSGSSGYTGIVALWCSVCGLGCRGDRGEPYWPLGRIG